MLIWLSIFRLLSIAKGLWLIVELHRGHRVPELEIVQDRLQRHTPADAARPVSVLQSVLDSLPPSDSSQH